MRKSLFGRTGLEISEIAFGGGVTGGILINANEATRWAALHRAELMEDWNLARADAQLKPIAPLE